MPPPSRRRWSVVDSAHFWAKLCRDSRQSNSAIDLSAQSHCVFLWRHEAERAKARSRIFDTELPLISVWWSTRLPPTSEESSLVYHRFQSFSSSDCSSLRTVSEAVNEQQLTVSNRVSPPDKELYNIPRYMHALFMQRSHPRRDHRAPKLFDGGIVVPFLTINVFGNTLNDDWIWLRRGFHSGLPPARIQFIQISGESTFLSESKAETSLSWQQEYF